MRRFRVVTGCTMLGALATHANVGDPVNTFIPPIVSGSLAARVAIKGVSAKDTSSI